MNTTTLLFYCLTFLALEGLTIGGMFMNTNAVNYVVTDLLQSFPVLPSNMPSDALGQIAQTIMTVFQALYFVVKSGITVSYVIIALARGVFDATIRYPILLPVNLFAVFGILYALVTKIRVMGSGFGGED